MKFFIPIIILGAIFWGSFNKENSTMKIENVSLGIEVADSDTERMKGLSGRENLAENKGLLFVFEEEGYWGIWMKDMNFPIDIAWLDKEKKIIHIEKNVSPNTYPKVFYPTNNGQQMLSLYILETNAGFFENQKIKIGDQAEF
jgi:hypothetical protein